MEESSSTSFHQGQRDDSGYGSPIFHQEYSSPQTLNSPYYSYAHNYHQHFNAYGNSSFQLYDPSLMVHQNLYSSGSTPFSLIHRNEQSPTTDLSAIPILDTTNPKELVETNPCPAYDYKINWVPPQGRRRRQRTVFTQSNVQQLDNVFMHNQYPDIELRESLAAQMGVPESRIQVWFKNRRTRARTAQRQQMKLAESSSSH